MKLQEYGEIFIFAARLAMLTINNSERVNNYSTALSF